MHHPGLQHSKSTSQLDVMMMQSGQKGCVFSLPPDENGNQQQQQRNKSISKFGLLIRTPRRRRANCFNQQVPDESLTNRLRSKSWDQQSGMNVTNNPGKSTWSGWRSLRKISDTLIDYALNEPYKADSVFDDGLLATSCKDPNTQSNGIYRRRSELVANDVLPSNTSSVGGLLGSKTVGHAQGVRDRKICFRKGINWTGIRYHHFRSAVIVDCDVFRTGVSCTTWICFIFLPDIFESSLPLCGTPRVMKKN